MERVFWWTHRIETQIADLLIMPNKALLSQTFKWLQATMKFSKLRENFISCPAFETFLYLFSFFLTKLSAFAL